MSSTRDAAFQPALGHAGCDLHCRPQQRVTVFGCRRLHRRPVRGTPSGGGELAKRRRASARHSVLHYLTHVQEATCRVVGLYMYVRVRVGKSVQHTVLVPEDRAVHLSGTTRADSSAGSERFGASSNKRDHLLLAALGGLRRGSKTPPQSEPLRLPNGPTMRGSFPPWLPRGFALARVGKRRPNIAGDCPTLGAVAHGPDTETGCPGSANTVPRLINTPPPRHFGMTPTNPCLRMKSRYNNPTEPIILPCTLHVPEKPVEASSTRLRMSVV